MQNGKMNTPTAPGRPLYRYRFGAAEFDEARFELRVGGLVTELERKPLEVLLELLRHAGEAVTKEELFDSVWLGRITVENVLANAVAKLRKALGETQAASIVTLSRIGYRLDGGIERIAVGRAAHSTLALSAGQPVPERAHFVLDLQLAHTLGAEVWRARHKKTGELRVYKFSLDGERLSALKREATLARVLRQSLGERADFVRVIDWNFESAPFFLESEYGGDSLAEWAGVGHLAAAAQPDRLRVFLGIADAVAAAHGVGVLHKDLKPANVLVAPDEARGWRVRLTDFGSGRLLEPGRLQELGITQLGMTVTQGAGSDPSSGTPLYLAPELIAGQPPTVQSDVYALGLMLYQLIVGDLRRTMATGWEADIADELLREDIAAATDGNPARRLASAAELIDRLNTRDTRRTEREHRRDAQHRAEAAERALERSRARRPWLIAALSSLLLGLAVSLWFYQAALQSRRSLAQQYEVAQAINLFMIRDLIGAANPAISGRSNVTVIEAAKAASPQIDRAFAGKAPEVQAVLHRALQESLSALTDSAGAIDEGRKAIDAYAQTRPVDSVGAAEARVRLAIDLATASRYAEASSLLDEVERDLPALQRASPVIAVRLPAARGQLARAQLHLAEALGHDERAWSLAKAQADTPAELRDQVEFSMADTLRMLGRLKESEALQRDLIERQSVTLGAAHPQTLYSTAALANSLVFQQRCEEAERLLLPVIDGLSTTLGPDHRRTLIAKGVLASAYFNQRKFDEAASIYAQVHDAMVHKYGENNQAAITQLFNVGMSTQYAGRPADAEPVYRSALSAARQLFAEDEAQVQTLRYHLADCLLDLDRPAEAGPLLAALSPAILNQSEQESDWPGRLDYQAGRLALARGDTASALALLDKAAHEIDQDDDSGGDRSLLAKLRTLVRDAGRPQLKSARAG
jgi:DNA-binding winged helix-turn-helix (wHTH) protein/serine/threonine protein kinase